MFIKLRRDQWESACCRISISKMAKITVITFESVCSSSCVSRLLLHNVAPRGGICHGDTGQHWCWVMDPLQLSVANDHLSVRLSPSDAAKKTFITEVSPPPVPVITVSVAPPLVILLLILCLRSFFSFGWIQTIMEGFGFKVYFPLHLFLFICCVKPTEYRQTTWLRSH